MTEPTNGTKARLDNLHDRTMENKLQIDLLRQNGCPTGRIKMMTVEQSMAGMKKDINEIFTRLRGVEMKQHYWGGGLAVLIVVIKFLT